MEITTRRQEITRTPCLMPRVVIALSFCIWLFSKSTIRYPTGANLPGANGSSLLVSQNGTYAVVSTNANGCADTSNCVTIDNIGLDEVATFHFNVVPNPFVNEISIAFDKDFTGTMNITDLGGKVVYSTAIDHQQQVTAVLSLSKGMYLIQVQDETGSKTLRVLKV
ncbi:MAG: T9SS C-terminal target domain-containing protein [Flavobacteriia bacterium]|nr:T9SS C-terminal target domain-containing protein [Flavobacteriia bacterium]